VHIRWKARQDVKTEWKGLGLVARDEIVYQKASIQTGFHSLPICSNFALLIDIHFAIDSQFNSTPASSIRAIKGASNKLDSISV
jgi:hypothetical protein